jgi:hypothetical protein
MQEEEADHQHRRSDGEQQPRMDGEEGSPCHGRRRRRVGSTVTAAEWSRQGAKDKRWKHGNISNNRPRSQRIADEGALDERHTGCKRDAHE